MPSEEQSLPGLGFRPLQSWRTHTRLMWMVLALVCLLGTPVAWKKGAPSYQTEALLYVAPRYMRNLTEDPELDFQSNSQYRQFVENQRNSVGRYDVLQEALLTLKQRGIVWQKPKETERKAIERLRENLNVVAVPDTYMLQLQLKSAQPDDLADILNAVVQSFLKHMRAEQFYGLDERVSALHQRESELLETMQQREAQRNTLAQNLSLTTFNEATPNPYDQLVTNQRTSLAQAREQRMKAQAALNAFQTRGDTQTSIRSVQEAVQNDPGLNSLKASLNARRAALLVQSSGLQAEHPGAMAAQHEIAEIEQEIQTQSRKIETAMRANLLARYQHDVDQALNVEKGLQQDLSTLEGQAHRYAELFQQAMGMTDDLKQTRTELDKVRQRLNDLDIENNSLGFLRLVTPAMPPEYPYGLGRKKLLLLVLLAALMAAAVAPVLVDLLDKRIRTVNDAQRLFGITPAGWQVERTGMAPTLFGDEQLRRMAAALMRTRTTRQQNIFGFTGCKPHAGTTTLVLDVAKTLKTLGYRVLVVEANGYSRDERFACDAGLLDVLRAQVNPQDVIIPAQDDWPDRVGIGAQNNVRLEHFERLTQTLHTWSHEYDFVLMDMPSLLTSADAELLARSVGQLLLVVQAGVVTRGELVRAKRVLQTLDPDAVGLIVNRVAPFEAAGYLKDLMLESITVRHREKFYTLPAWRLHWEMLRLSWARRHNRSQLANPSLSKNLTSKV